MIYLWLKAFHVAAAIIFGAGLLAGSILIGALTHIGGAKERHALVGFVRQWSGSVTTRAMLLTWALGITLALLGHWFSSPWLMTKLAFVVSLSGLHGVLSASLRRLANPHMADTPSRTMIYSSIIVGSVASISVRAIVKPF